MTDLTRVAATFAMHASMYGEIDLDITGLSPAEIADLVWTKASVRPDVEKLIRFSIDGVSYSKTGQHWGVDPWSVVREDQPGPVAS